MRSRYGNKKKTFGSFVFFTLMLLLVITAVGWMLTNNLSCPNGRRDWKWMALPPGYACYTNY